MEQSLDRGTIAPHRGIQQLQFERANLLDGTTCLAIGIWWLAGHTSTDSSDQLAHAVSRSSSTVPLTEHRGENLSTLSGRPARSSPPTPQPVRALRLAPAQRDARLDRRHALGFESSDESFLRLARGGLALIFAGSPRRGCSLARAGGNVLGAGLRGPSEDIRESRLEPVESARSCGFASFVRPVGQALQE
jgi:hypothetical protein